MKILLAMFLIMYLLPGGFASAEPLRFLEEKTAYCYTQAALSKYFNYAKKRNLEGMNRLVLKGKCDFVPDGEVIRLKNYRTDSIGNIKIVKFKMNNIPVWTFNTLVQTTDFSNL